jgi:hypothetical protein
VAIIKKVKDKRPAETGKAIRDVTQPSISYSNEGLANLIVKVWTTKSIEDDVLERNAKGVPTANAVTKATDLVNTETGMKLKRAVIITEEEHDNDYTMQNDDEVVFVLPNEGRVVAAASQAERLETAKMLMACTPNGI